METFKKVNLATYKDMVITGHFMPSKRGKAPDRLWISVRNLKDGQNNKWEVRENLSYVHGVDVLFRQKDTPKKKKEYV